MTKALLGSVIVGLVAIPLFAAREPRPARALKKALFYGAGFNVVYALALRYVLPRL